MKRVQSKKVKCLITKQKKRKKSKEAWMIKSEDRKLFIFLIRDRAFDENAGQTSMGKVV